jgi:hypothetical protein
MKHTPAPWDTTIYADHSLQQEFHMVKIGDYAYMIGHRDLDKANARLIASAPELLDALKNLLAVMEGEGGTKTNAQETARQAIAKAEGA